jgi:hypothetical protein
MLAFMTWLLVSIVESELQSPRGVAHIFSAGSAPRLRATLDLVP